MSLFNKEDNYFGLDIGSTGIRLVQLKKSGAKPALVTYGHIPVPAGMTTSDAAIDLDRVADAIKQLVRETKVSTKNVVAGLPSAKVFASVITTPTLSDSELAKAIKYQAEQYVPMALDQVKMDWSVVDKSPDGKNLEVLIIAAPNTIATKYLEILEKAELEVLALETNATALARALVPQQSGLAVMLLDMSSISTDLTILHNDAPKLIRSVSIGGDTFVRSVAQALGLDDAQAQQFTHKFGLTQTKLEGQVYKALKQGLDTLMEEIDKSIKFFVGRYPDVKLEKIIVTGGTAALPEFPTFLANATGLPVEIGNSWINVSYPAGLQEQLMQLSISYGVASGLAQRMFV